MEPAPPTRAACTAQSALNLVRTAVCPGSCERTLHVHATGEVLIYVEERDAHAVLRTGATCQECRAPTCGGPAEGCHLERCPSCGGRVCVWCFGSLGTCPSCRDLHSAHT